MQHTQPSETCHYCGHPAAYRLVYLDEAAGLDVCRDHFADGYDVADAANTMSFLPPDISRLDTLTEATA